jgi:hypothetical protein
MDIENMELLKMSLAELLYFALFGRKATGDELVPPQQWLNGAKGVGMAEPSVA